MIELIPIRGSSRRVDQEAKVYVWLTDKRLSGKIIFLQLHDGTTFFQGAARKNDVSEEVLEAAKSLRQEVSFYITGTVHEDECSHLGYEVRISDLEIVSNDEDCLIGNKEHGVDFLPDNRHLWLGSKRPFVIMQTGNTMFRAAVDFFEKEGLIKFDVPIFMHSAPEDTTQLFHAEYFNNGAYLSQSSQLYGETGTVVHGETFTFGPTFRAEESKDRRHMTGFWMMGPEMAWMHQDGSLDAQGRYLAYMAKQVLESNEYELRISGRDPEKSCPTTEDNFIRLPYDDAIKVFQEANRGIKWGDDFGAPDEGYISKQLDRPIFVINYPTATKPSHMKKDPGNPKEYLCADVIAPEGCDGIFDSSEREGDYEILKKQIEEIRLNLEGHQ